MPTMDRRTFGSAVGRALLGGWAHVRKAAVRAPTHRPEVLMPARPADTPASVSAPVAVAPFRIPVDLAAWDDLRARLARTRWNDAVTDDWRYGTRRATLEALVDHWRHRYDWPARAAALNALPQYRAVVDGFGVHFLHLRGRAPTSGPAPRPLLLLNGWPSSFVEYTRLAPRLADPARFGGDPADAFDVVVPALPGFGFSDRPTRPDQVRAPDLFHRLMTAGLGYTRYLAVGTDIGAGVATRLALAHPEAVAGLHVATVVDPPLGPDAPRLTPAERAYQDRVRRWHDEDGAYQALQSTRPQTLAFALADSPAGLASWVLEKFYLWSDRTAADGDVFAVFPPEMLLDTLMVYWTTNTIGASVRAYYEARHFRPPLRAGDRVRVPTAVAMFPRDLVTAPREWAERFYDVARYSTFPRGGHFPAWEVPEAYGADLTAFARAIAAP